MFLLFCTTCSFQIGKHRNLYKNCLNASCHAEHAKNDCYAIVSNVGSPSRKYYCPHLTEIYNVLSTKGHMPTNVTQSFNTATAKVTLTSTEIRIFH